MPALNFSSANLIMTFYVVASRLSKKIVETGQCQVSVTSWMSPVHHPGTINILENCAKNYGDTIQDYSVKFYDESDYRVNFSLEDFEPVWGDSRHGPWLVDVILATNCDSDHDTDNSKFLFMSE